MVGNKKSSRLLISVAFSAAVLMLQTAMNAIVFFMLYNKLIFGIRECDFVGFLLYISGAIVFELIFIWIPYAILYYILLKHDNFIEGYLFNDKRIIINPILLGIVNSLFFLFISFLLFPILSGVFSLGLPDKIPFFIKYPLYFSIVILTPVLCRLLKIDSFVINYYNQTIKEN